jgi:hypothetical protein
MARKLKFGSPAWRKKYMKKKRPAARKKRTNPLTPLQKALKEKRAHQKLEKRRRKEARIRAQRYPKYDAIGDRKRGNPPKLKRLKRSTGWMKASAVKIVKKGRQMQVLVRKKAR